MGRNAESAAEAMYWEGAPVHEAVNWEGTPSPVTPQPQSVEGIKNSRFPERNGRIRFDSALELVESAVKNGQSIKDWSLFNSAVEMDDVTDRQSVKDQ